jgi:hypothetical protein
VVGDGTDVAPLAVDQATEGSTPTPVTGGDGTNVEGGTILPQPTAQPTATVTAPDAADTGTGALTPLAEPSPTLAPVSVGDGMVASVIGPEGGVLTSPAGLSIAFPASALAEPATVTIRPVGDGKVFAPRGFELVAGTTYDVTLASASGRGITQLAVPATLRIPLGPNQWRSGARIYVVDTSSLTELQGGRLDDDAVNASVSHFSRFTVAVPVETESGGSSTLIFIVLAVAAGVTMLIATTLVSLLRRGRPRSVGRRR